MKGYSQCLIDWVFDQTHIALIVYFIIKTAPLGGSTFKIVVEEILLREKWECLPLVLGHLKSESNLLSLTLLKLAGNGHYDHFVSALKVGADPLMAFVIHSMIALSMYHFRTALQSLWPKTRLGKETPLILPDAVHDSLFGARGLPSR